MIKMAVIDNCYPRNAQIVESDAREVQFIEYPEPVTKDDTNNDKFVDFSLANPDDFEFVGYQSVPVFRMKTDAAAQFIREYHEC